MCGALARGSVLPKNSDTEGDTILTVVTVAALSTLAMIFYPMGVSALGLDNQHAGLFLGGTIHDVAQVVGAGYMISPETGDIATYVKMLRVAMLLPVVIVLVVIMSRREGSAGPRTVQLVPTFLIGFIALVCINSFGLIPQQGVALLNDVSRWCLVTAIAALGMKTSFKKLVAVGWRPIGLMAIETAWIAVVVLGAVIWLL